MSYRFYRLSRTSGGHDSAATEELRIHLKYLKLAMKEHRFSVMTQSFYSTLFAHGEGVRPTRVEPSKVLRRITPVSNWKILETIPLES